MRNDYGLAGNAEIVKLIRHELKTPLATALLYLGIAEGSAAEVPGTTLKTALRVARVEVQRLKTLIDTLTELECVGYATVRPRLVDVGETVRATVQRLTALGNVPGVRVVTLGKLQGWWDRSMVEQIVSNLLSNAVKFGQGRPIRVEVRPVGAGACLVVRDHGIGVPPAEQSSIFERNVHAPLEQGGGLGLGLWLVRELAAAHGGWVTVESRKGHGATFTVFLRARRPTATVGGRPAALPASLVGLRRRYWHDRAVRSHTKVPLLARKVTDDPAVPLSTTMLPSVTGTLKPTKPSKIRRSIDVSPV
jgi:signal transduction histidine kinase